MHILLGLLTLLTVIGVWIWRLQMARRGLDAAADVAETIANAPRRFAFRYRAGKGGLDLIEDPREAASIMLVLMARAYSGEVTEHQAGVIESEIRDNFHVSAKDAEELAAHANWVARTCPPAQDAMRVLSRKIVNSAQLGPKEVVDLDSMLVAVSEAEGLPTRTQLSLLQVYRDLAGLKT